MAASERVVGATITGTVGTTSAMVLSMAVAAGTPVDDERITATVDGTSFALREIGAGHGTRLHVAEQVPAGELEVVYTATVTGPGDVPDGDELDRIVASRPSRYCPSDAMVALATSEFGDQRGADLLATVAARVHDALVYDGSETRPTDTALDTWLRRTGVCRDYAHVTAAFLRALGVPARLVSVYAPGLDPMDFHAVVEAWTGDGWHVADATRLARRDGLVRIATGRDAADTAFLSVLDGTFTMGDLLVSAAGGDPRATDDHDHPVQLR